MSFLQTGGINMCEKDAKIDEFVQKFHENGIGCGLEISKLAKDMHPNAVTISHCTGLVL